MARRSLSKQKPKRKVDVTFLFILLLLVIAFGFGLIHEKKVTNHPITPLARTDVSKKVSTAAPTTTTTTNQPAAPKDYCSANDLSQLIIVSIADQHVWACDGSQQVYSTPVITGMENYPADLTPPGTYYIYAKETDQHLAGCDSTGCWNDFVYYWMPFLSNRYGIYGFHDATWRSSSEFGNTDIYSDNASHGCVEMPLTAAAWLYNWSHVGTELDIES